MLAKRVIPCLDVDGGRVVKGTKFQDLRDAGDPVELAARYDREGADELVFLDITATVEGRDGDARRDRADRRAGVHPAHRGRRRADRRRCQRTAARRRRQGLAEQRRRARTRRCCSGAPTGSAPSAWWWRSTRSAGAAADGGWEVFVDAGRTGTGRDAVEWAAEATTQRGAGEVLLTSMDRDGTGDGYDLALLARDRRRRAGARDRQRRRRRTRALRGRAHRGWGGCGARRQHAAFRPAHDRADQGALAAHDLPVRR